MDSYSMDLRAEHLVFIDETWAKTNLARTHGRSRRGTRLIAKVPYGHWKTTTFVAALRCDGLTAPIRCLAGHVVRDSMPLSTIGYLPRKVGKHGETSNADTLPTN